MRSSKSLRTEFDSLGLDYFFNSSDINPLENGVDRIQALAELRDLALQPLINHEAEFNENATVVFLNDVAACPDDILELIHQRSIQDADMTCAMDWTYVGNDPTFYDVWVSRGMTGESFFRIPEDVSWDYAWHLFWNDPESRAHLDAGKPFQAFSCWNGAVAFTAAPIVSEQIKFRAHYEGESFQGEPKLFCKDMWAHGHGRIAVVPSVNLEYSDEQARKIKELKGYVQSWTANEGDDVKTEWRDEWGGMKKQKVRRNYERICPRL
jgi:alpha-1,3-mannosyltransferase